MMEVKAADVIRHAADLVSGDRAAQNGDATLNLQNIAAVWNGILTAAGVLTSRPLDAHDVANLMEGFKIARRYSGAFNSDDYADAAGYAGLAAEVQSKLTKG
jgi:hypothetical protein